MKTLLIPADPSLVIYDPATRKRVTMDGVRVDARSPFWRRLVTRARMVAPEVDPAPAPAPAPAATRQPQRKPAPITPVVSED